MANPYKSWNVELKYDVGDIILSGIGSEYFMIIEKFATDPATLKEWAYKLYSLDTEEVQYTNHLFEQHSWKVA